MASSDRRVEIVRDWVHDRRLVRVDEELWEDTRDRDGKILRRRFEAGEDTRPDRVPRSERRSSRDESRSRTPHQRRPVPIPRNHSQDSQAGAVIGGRSSNTHVNIGQEFSINRIHTAAYSPSSGGQYFELSRPQPQRHISTRAVEGATEPPNDPISASLKARSSAHPPPSTPRLTGATTTSTPVAENPRSRLSSEALIFIQIKLGDFRACRRFIYDSPAVLDEAPQLLLEYAAHLEKQQKHDEALRCLERMLVIRECGDKSHNETVVYINDLIDRRKPAYEDFIKQSKAVREAVHSMAQRGPTAVKAETSAPPPRVSNDPRHASRGSSAQRLESRNLPSSPPQPRPAAPTSLLRRMSINDSRHRPQGPALRDPIFSPGDRDYVPPVGDEAEEQERSVWSTGVVDISDGPRTEVLDPKYQLREKAHNFFKVGRVFALLWHENMGNSTQHPRPQPKEHLGELVQARIDRSVTKGPFGELIYSHIRRMAVVREKRGYCWCIPINSYGKQGVLGKKFSKDDREAHAVIHNELRAAVPFRGEGLVKDPISVVMARGEDLDEASRIHFGKPYSVEWNVKVMDIGTISKRSYPTFRAYWQAEAVDPPGRR